METGILRSSRRWIITGINMAAARTFAWSILATWLKLIRRLKLSWRAGSRSARFVQFCPVTYG